MIGNKYPIVDREDDPSIAGNERTIDGSQMNTML